MSETTASNQQLNPLYSSLFPDADQTTSTSLFDEIQQSFSDPESDQLLTESAEIWLPKKETADILELCRNGNNRKTSRSLLTKPTLEFDRNLDDPVLDIVCQLEKSHGNQIQKRRQIVTADNCAQNVSGMRSLIESGCFRAAINLSERLLKSFDNLSNVTDAEKSHSPDSLKIWYWRLALLKRTGFETDAQKEAKRFKDLDQPDLYFEFYPDVYGETRRTGSMVPFEMRLLIADFGSFKDRLRKLFRLLSICKQIVRNLQQENSSNVTGINLWQQRCKQTLHSLINCAFAKKDFSLAIDLANECIANCGETDSHSKHIYYCLLGSIYLETCDLKMAKLYFAKIPAEKTLDIGSLTNFSLIAIGEHNYADAETFLKQLHEMKPNMLPIANNLAVCAIRQNRMNEIRQFLERIIQTNLTNQLLISQANQQLLLLLWQIYESRLTKMAGSRAKQNLLKDLATLNCDIPQHILTKFKNFL